MKIKINGNHENVKIIPEHLAPPCRAHILNEYKGITENHENLQNHEKYNFTICNFYDENALFRPGAKVIENPGEY